MFCDFWACGFETGGSVGAFPAPLARISIHHESPSIADDDLFLLTLYQIAVPFCQFRTLVIILSSVKIHTLALFQSSMKVRGKMYEKKVVS